MKPPHIVETCLVHEVEPTLERLEPEYDLHAMSSHQVGSGFGAYVQVLLLFRLRARPTPEMNGNGVTHGTGYRRKPTVQEKRA